MSCPFMDASMLERMSEEKREEMKNIYEKMKQEQESKIQIDKDKEITECPFKQDDSTGTF